MVLHTRGLRCRIAESAPAQVGGDIAILVAGLATSQALNQASTRSQDGRIAIRSAAA